ncbi:MAG: T9SS type A sorting domain-containing protein, partial [bacterium]|nr:T9SS type A sorting domain-containing protein [bacterium]
MRPTGRYLERKKRFLTSGIKISLADTAIYPNPVSDTLNINIPYTGISEVSIYDIKGRLAFEGVTNSGNFTWELTDKSSNRVNPGVYIVKITSD